MTAQGLRTDHPMADLKNLLRQEAAQCRRLAELVTEQTIRQALIEMAATTTSSSWAAARPSQARGELGRATNS
jgi:hypothetical protein